MDALFDSGFTGFMAINTQDLDGLNWNYVDKEILRTVRVKSRLKDIWVK